MTSAPKSHDQLMRENESLRTRLEEADDLLSAVRAGRIDALMVENAQGPRVYTLRGADQPYRIYVECMNEGAVTLATDSTILYANRQFATFIGEALQQTVGKTFRNFVTRADHDAFADLLREVNNGSRRAEIALENRSGAPVPVRISGRPMELDGDRFICLVVTDLRGQKLQEQLREADRRKDHFLAMLGHELRNPLAIIHNVLQVLRKKHGADLSAEMRGMIEDQARSMGRLIDDLLDVSRIANGKIHLDRSRFDLVKELANTVLGYRDELEANGVTLELKLPSERVFMQGDKVRIVQAIGNLLHNAGKFTDHGGTVNVTLSIATDGRSAAIAVCDTGIGMDRETLEMAFDTFSQADRSLARSRGGLGLGLALVKGLIELHGGKVTASSAGPGHGSEFIIHLPIETAPSPALEEAPVASHSRDFRILVIEDNRAGALSLQMLLSQLGHRVEVAYNGVDGLATAMRFKPEVVLCDIGLPGLDGYQIAQRLRASEESRQTFLVALSGYGRDADKQRALEAGFDLHYVKPLNIDLLEKALANLS